VASLQKLDPYECEIGEGALALTKTDYFKMSTAELVDEAKRLGFEISADPESFREFIQRGPVVLQQMAQSSNLHTSVSCWHLSDTESFGMWEAYLKGKPGVAIVTNVSLLESLANGIAQGIVAIGPVAYKDIDHEPVTFHKWGRVFVKRPYFASEREFRIAIEIDPPPGVPSGDFLGLRIPIKPEGFIQEVWMPPLAEKWQIAAVETTIRKFGIHAPIRTSRVFERPPHFFYDGTQVHRASSPQAAQEALRARHFEKFIKVSFIFQDQTHELQIERKDGLTARDVVDSSLRDRQLLNRFEIVPMGNLVILDIEREKEMRPTDRIDETRNHVGFYEKSQTVVPNDEQATMLIARMIKSMEQIKGARPPGSIAPPEE
jgi:hypothetical protein